MALPSRHVDAPRLRRIASVLLLPTLLFLSGCDQKADDRFRKPIARSGAGLDKEAEENVTIETASRTVEIMSGGGGWPSGIPSEVPPFLDGSISSVARTASAEGMSWSITLGDITSDAVKHYETQLGEHGFHTSSMIVGNGGSVTGQNGNISIAVVANSGNATISVALKN